MRDDAGRQADATERTGNRREHGDRGEAADPEGSSGNVAGDFSPSETIEPGRPRLGNALFVLFGAYLTVLAVTRLFVDVQGFTARDFLAVTAGTLVVAVVCFGFFGLLTPDT